MSNLYTRKNNFIKKASKYHNEKLTTQEFIIKAWCKHACPTYGQKKYPKGFKIDTSREVQPHLRKLVLKRDDYTC